MITIVDYKAGNLTSVKLAFESLGVDSQITRDPNTVANAERVVFPGVGCAGASMDHVREFELVDALSSVISGGTPFLGICLGMQILFDFSEEDGGINCLGIISGKVIKFQPTDPFDKIPQIGWNRVNLVKQHPVFEDIENNSEFYFVHSYYIKPDSDANLLGETDYADAVFCSAATKDNVVATQFHPEKSGRIGLKILENFSTWEGTC